MTTMTYSKYGNKRTEYKGVLYDSKREADHARLLDTLRSAVNPKDRVVEWRRQIPFAASINGKKCFTYIADFFVRYADGREEVIDVKGMRTDVYKLKKKVIEALYGITIIET